MMPGAGGAAPPLLCVRGIDVRAGPAWRLRDVAIDVQAGKAVAVLGARGSGKTALLDVISGFVRPEQGRVAFDGRDVTRWPPHRIARAGVARSFQNAAAPEGCAVVDAVRAAAVGRGLGHHAAARLVAEALAATGLEADARREAASLPPDRLRLLWIARVAAAAPRLALLDEPLAGLAPAGAGRVISVLRRLEALGIAMIVTGHDPEALRAVCPRAVLLRDGRIAAAGRLADLARA
jgi:ABC-type branched-subunit amino acid transport system ATPase component